MLFIISLFVMYILISFLVFKTSNDHDRITNAIIGFMVPFVISFIAICILIGSSYSSYIGLKQYDVTIQQYANSINLYSKLAVPNKDVTQSIEITDLKYQNYQVSIKELIEKLRGRVVYYNKVLIGKRELGNNIIFSWLIIMPDKDMKILKMEDFISVK